MAKDIFLIGNPIAGNGAGEKIKKAVTILKNRGYAARLLLTQKKGDAELFAREIASEFGIQTSEAAKMGSNLLTVASYPLPLVIAAGGDGTYNEIANGLVHSNIPMAILPFGTSCLLAKELKIPRKIEVAIDIALDGRIQTIHLGKIITRDVSRYFLLMAGIGFDGKVVFNLNKKVKRYTGKLAYILSGLEVILKYIPTPLIINFGFKHLHSLTGLMMEPQCPLSSLPPPHHLPSQTDGYVVIVGNAAYYGGDFKITPDARLTDTHFYVFVAHKKGRLNLMRYILGIISGCHLKFKDIAYFKSTELSIEGAAQIQIDGEYIGITPAKVGIVPEALKLVVAVSSNSFVIPCQCNFNKSTQQPIYLDLPSKSRAMHIPEKGYLKSLKRPIYHRL
ncbi:diacylglycerol kinase family lipid kinase [Thermodesulfovibrionales bacterium]|nr:diacylglycerol kinase family lipid kinase [Thermodesulfovibrionales bacterium]